MSPRPVQAHDHRRQPAANPFERHRPYPHVTSTASPETALFSGLLERRDGHQRRDPDRRIGSHPARPMRGTGRYAKPRTATRGRYVTRYSIPPMSTSAETSAARFGARPAGTAGRNRRHPGGPGDGPIRRLGGARCHRWMLDRARRRVRPALRTAQSGITGRPGQALM